MKLLLGALSLVLLVPAAPAATGATGTSESAADTPRSAATTSPAKRKAAPAIRARRQVTGLQHPWDVKPIRGGRLLITERDSRHLLLWQAGRTRRVSFPSRRIWVSGETGLMSMEVDPNFARNGRFYTCSGWKAGGRHDIRVIAWRLNGAGTRASLVETLVGGFPTTSGRHGGCRLLITQGGLLMVGTGDAANHRNPRNLKSLGGKTLRLDRLTGRPFSGNKWANAANRRKRYVFTFGHRNVQGLAQRNDGTLWSVEHGSTRDDEVNRLGRGHDYGWQPRPGYVETGVPMTDKSLPGRQFGARWRSGNPTVATSGATWVRGARWGAYQGTLAVACLKASRVIFMKFNRVGTLKWTRAPRRLRDFGRLRSVERAPNNDLLITTGNGRNDSVVRVSPR